ncbi:MAG: MarR family transcriptional regulator [Candidatus Marinimicrobia bacterium]|nr:MarR family transcriptional regulator [Candidatus Neomarinimicrobiota bacterium]
MENFKDLSTIDTATAYQVHKTSRMLRVHLMSFFKRHGYDLSPEQWFIMFRLHEKEGQTQTELTDKELADYPNVTRLLDALEKKNFIERRPDPEDRRKSLIFAQGTGNKFLATILQELPAERKEVFKGIDTEQMETFNTVLSRIQKNISSS